MYSLRAVFCTLSLVCLLPQAAIGQREVDGIEVYGDLTNSVNGLPIHDLTVTLEQDGNILHTTATSQDSGYFKVDLPYDGQFILRFIKEGYVPEFLTIDTRGMPAKVGGYGVNLSLTMLPLIPGRDHSFSDLPRDCAKYDRKKKEIMFDIPYAKERRAARSRYLRP